jgi:nucleoside-diphosphate-sugar epimerase
MQTIGILGCGWLGKPLGKLLVEKGFSVKGTTTQMDNFQSLKTLGIQAFEVRLTEEKIEGEIDNFLSGLDFLIIAIPPGLRRNPEIDFTRKIDLLRKKLKPLSLKKIIFVSSTSVFENTADVPVYTENSQPNSTQNNGVQLAEAEKIVKTMQAEHQIILRFGGLLGEDRHPVNYFADKNNLKNADAPVNLIHHNDAIRLILSILSTEFSEDQQIFHGVNPDHPSREEFYVSAARQKDLNEPVFDAESEVSGKRISSKGTRSILGFEFKSKLS